jgi:hypothetical protein
LHLNFAPWPPPVTSETRATTRLNKFGVYPAALNAQIPPEELPVGRLSVSQYRVQLRLTPVSGGRDHDLTPDATTDAVSPFVQ